MAWNSTLPDGDVAVNLGDEAIRDNYDYLEAALPSNMVFPGTVQTRGRLLLTKGNKAARDAILIPVNGQLFARTDISPGGIDMLEVVVWKRKLGPQVGEIQPYFGNPATLAADRPGWALCDGSIVNGTQTPDLRGKFLVGRDTSDSDFVSTGTTGGAKTVTLTIAEMPAHNHGGVTGGPSITLSRLASLLNRDGQIGSATPTGSHNHPITPAGSGSSHENRPPFYTLAFIMFVDV